MKLKLLQGMGLTKPGLGLEINKAAINPTPKKMIKRIFMKLEKTFLK